MSHGARFFPMSLFSVEWSATELVQPVLDPNIAQCAVSNQAGWTNCGGLTKIEAQSQHEADEIMRDVIRYSRRPVIRRATPTPPLPIFKKTQAQSA